METSIETPLEPAIAIVHGSTKKQVNTIPTQERIVRRYADVKCFDMRCVFEDPCTSAEKIPFLQREVVATALAYCCDHGIRHIILTSIDHAFRGVEDCCETIRILICGENNDDLFAINMAGIKGTAIHIVENGIDSRDEQCLLILTIRATCAEEQTRKRSDRMKEAFTGMRQTGQRTGAVSFGWDAITSTRTSKTGRAADDLIVNPIEYRWLLQIMAWHREGVSDCEISRRLNRAGVKTKNAGQSLSRTIKDAAGNATRIKRWVCDGKWQAATVLSVRKHARLAEEHKGSATAPPQARDKKATQKATHPDQGQRETATPAYAQLHCPACSHALRLTLPLQGRLWNCPNCKTRFTVAFDRAGHMATHIKLPTNDPSFDRTWQEVLGVETSASVAQIKAAYIALIKKSHPDKVASMSDEFTKLAERKAKEINRAYEEALAKRANG